MSRSPSPVSTRVRPSPILEQQASADEPPPQATIRPVHQPAADRAEGAAIYVMDLHRLQSLPPLKAFGTEPDRKASLSVGSSAFIAAAVPGSC